MSTNGRIRLLFLTLFTLVQVLPVRGEDLPDDVMPLSEVRAGMKGEAFSVVHGFKPERYEVEILGIERGGLPGTSMILSVVQGPSIEQHGIVAGMSGSPVYIDGKIIGAIAYGFQFAYRPIAGITPIEDMLPVLNLLDEPADSETASLPQPGRSRASRAGWDWQTEFDAYAGYQTTEDRLSTREFRATQPELVETLGSEPLRMIPLVAPFYVSGLVPAAATSLQSFFDARGLTLMPVGSNAGSNEQPETPSPPMMAGSALAIPIMTGDLTIAATGTATYRRGDHIIGFGHPAFSRGRTRAPMAQAYMIAYMQSYALSFKLGESREIVGSVLQDKEFAIGGVFGEAPPRISIDVALKGDAVEPERTYHYSVWEDRDFAPMFSMVALMQSLGAAAAPAAEMTGDLEYRITLADGRVIHKRDRTSSRGGLGFAFGMSLLQDVFLLMGNPFQPADIESIQIDLKVDEGFRVDRLLSAQPEARRLEPGETVEVATRWQPYRGEAYARKLKLKLPEDLKAGHYVVHIADSSTSHRIDTLHNRGGFRPRSLEDVLDLVDRLEYPENQVRLMMFEPEFGISLQGETIEGIPGSMESVMAVTAPDDMTQPVVGRRIGSATFDFETAATGRASFLIEVSHHVPR